MNKSTLGIVAVAAVALGAGAALTLSDLLAPKYGIILRVTKADISDDQWTQIQAVLDKAPVTANADARKKLYRVREFANGSLVGDEDVGELAETQLLEERHLAELQAANFTGHAFQIGVGAMERSQRIPKNGTDTLHAHFRPNIVESKEMVKEVNDVLK
jgi:hypothetical protein